MPRPARPQPSVAGEPDELFWTVFWWFRRRDGLSSINAVRAGYSVCRYWSAGHGNVSQLVRDKAARAVQWIDGITAEMDAAPSVWRPS